VTDPEASASQTSTSAPAPVNDVLIQIRNLIDTIEARRAGDLANAHRSAVNALAELRATR